MKTKKELTVFSKTGQYIMDQEHVVGFGKMKNLQPNIIKDFYGESEFNFEYLEKAKKFFESVVGTNLKHWKIRCLIPKRNAPVIFVCSLPVRNEGKTTEEEIFYAIAPRGIPSND